MNQNLLKGMFILLVVMDHNDFARGVIPGFLQGFGFHVMGFMIVPFLRPPGALDRNFMQYLFRLYYPFLIIVTVMSITVAWITPISAVEQVGRWAMALYNGNSSTLKSATHMALLWFLPSFITLIVLRTVIENVHPRLKTVVILGAWLVHPFIGQIAPSTQDYLPLGLLPALYVLPLAYLGIYVHYHYFASLNKGNALIQSGIMFILVKACQMHFGFTNEIGFAAVAGADQWLALLCNDLEALTGVLMLFQACRFTLRFAFGSLLEAFGRYSLQVYLLHAFVALLIYKLALASGMTSVTSLFAFTLLATALLTLVLARFAATQPHIRRLLFPRNWRDFIQWSHPPVTIPASTVPGSTDMLDRNNRR